MGAIPSGANRGWVPGEFAPKAQHSTCASTVWRRIAFGALRCRTLADMPDDLTGDPTDDPIDDISTRMYAAIAEPADYDSASASTVLITDEWSLALASRRMRRHARASQRAFAVAAGLSKTTVARIETGAVDPTVGVLLRMAH